MDIDRYNLRRIRAIIWYESKGSARNFYSSQQKLLKAIKMRHNNNRKYWWLVWRWEYFIFYFCGGIGFDGTHRGPLRPTSPNRLGKCGVYLLGPKLVLELGPWLLWKLCTTIPNFFPTLKSHLYCVRICMLLSPSLLPLFFSDKIQCHCPNLNCFSVLYRRVCVCVCLLYLCMCVCMYV